MIVKNEAHVIRRCLDSMLPLVDHVLIVDTGSTDGTQRAIRAWLREVGMPGEVVEEPWRDFAYNRTYGLDRMRERREIDYVFVIDADDVLVREPGFDPAAFKHALDRDTYAVFIHQGGTRYTRPLLFSNRKPYRYRAVLHEYLECPPDHTHTTAAGFHVLLLQESDRNKNPRKYADDARVLETALTKETDPFLISRYRFYLAQSYLDHGDLAKALENYLERAALGHWDQEVYISMLRAAEIKRRMNAPPAEVVEAYWAAIRQCPARAEAYHGASNYLRLQNRFSEGYEIARLALDLEPPRDGLFVELWVYRFGLLDEYSVNAYWAGHYQKSLDACERILALTQIDLATRERIAKNAAFAKAKLSQPGAVEVASQRPAGIRASGEAVATPTWAPQRPQGGTEIMVEGLRLRLGDRLDAISLGINGFDPSDTSGKPLVVWLHHNVDQQWVQWCRERTLVDRVARFVFVSHWQLERYVRAFDLPRERCLVLHNAVSIEVEPRPWELGPKRQFAYTSTPFRGLSVLLDAWDRLKAKDAELHIWSSMALYANPAADADYAHLYDRARALPNVSYHGAVPNHDLRQRLRTIDFLVYPSTFEETSCLSVIEAMAAGCRVICPALGALPDTSAGFARIYPAQPSPEAHAATVASVIADELAHPWQGRMEMAMLQQAYCKGIYDWTIRTAEWQDLIDELAGRRSLPRRSARHG